MRATSLLVTGLLLVPDAGATMAPRLSFEELVARSERIVHGRCLRSWSAWDAPGRFIWTHTEIQLLDRLKGSAVTVVVSELGGIVGGLGLAVEGVPRYQPGEEVVLFLYQTPIGYWRARGLEQGVYRVSGAGAQELKTRVRVLLPPDGVGR